MYFRIKFRYWFKKELTFYTRNEIVPMYQIELAQHSVKSRVDEARWHCFRKSPALFYSASTGTGSSRLDFCQYHHFSLSIVVMLLLPVYWKPCTRSQNGHLFSHPVCAMMAKLLDRNVFSYFRIFVLQYRYFRIFVFSILRLINTGTGNENNEFRACISLFLFTSTCSFLRDRLRSITEKATNIYRYYMIKFYSYIFQKCFPGYYCTDFFSSFF